MRYDRRLDELEKVAVRWWPESLTDANKKVSILPKLLETQDDFLRILSLSKNNPYHVFELIEAAKFPANLFLKHLCVLANYGGEPIQRLSASFKKIFDKHPRGYTFTFAWNAQNYTYNFKALPVSGLGNPKLFIDGSGLTLEKPLNDLYKDMILILMFGASSTVSHEAGLVACEIGTLLGQPAVLEQYVKQRYIHVSTIMRGAKANQLGQLAQKKVVDTLTATLGHAYTVTSNGTIPLVGYDKELGMPFDIVVSKGSMKIGIEISFQVTTNSTIERKAGQAADRATLMHDNGYKIAYVLDGAGNFQESQHYRPFAVTAIALWHTLHLNLTFYANG